jgi:hypothetical protein
MRYINDIHHFYDLAQMDETSVSDQQNRGVPDETRLLHLNLESDVHTAGNNDPAQYEPGSVSRLSLLQGIWGNDQAGGGQNDPTGLQPTYNIANRFPAQNAWAYLIALLEYERLHNSRMGHAPLTMKRSPILPIDYIEGSNHTAHRSNYIPPANQPFYPKVEPPANAHSQLYDWQQFFENATEMKKIRYYWNYIHPTNPRTRYAYAKNFDSGVPVEINGTLRYNPGTLLPNGTYNSTHSFDKAPGRPGQDTSHQNWLNYYDYDISTQCWDPMCFPTPQYIPMATPSDKSSERFIDETSFVNENQTCFGTYLEASEAQVRRSHISLYPLKVPQTDLLYAGLAERLTYIVKNVQVVTQQIILPRTAALSIVENALSGGITMETTCWKEIESIMPRAASQKHLINMAASFCTNITFLFRPLQCFQGDRAYGYNSFSFYNPFTSLVLNSSTDGIQPGGTGTPDTNDIGGKVAFYNECVINNRVAFDIQLQLATELIPRQPISSINSLIRNIKWGDQIFVDRDYLDLDPRLHATYGTSPMNGFMINTMQDGFWSCFVPLEALDDQTLTSNPFFTTQEYTLERKIRGQRHPSGGVLPVFKPYDGTFHLSFCLEAYMGQGDRMRTGVPIVNNNLFLKFEKGHLVRDYDTQLLTIVDCDGRIVFERGGTMQFFT